MLNMLKLGNYDGIKELLKTTPSQDNISEEVTKICNLGLEYLRHILDINFELNGNEIVFPEHFRQEWHYELAAYKPCLEDCLKIIGSETDLKSLIKELDEKISDHESQLWPGFLSSPNDVLEVSIAYKTCKEFKARMEQIALIEDFINEK